MTPLADDLGQRRFTIVDATLFGFVVTRILLDSGRLTRMERFGKWAQA
jgi:hypothetical protein